MERIIETEGIAGRALTWEQLGMEAGVEACGRTIKTTMGTLDYKKCLACKKGWVDQRIAERRLAFAKCMLERYPEKNDWKHVRFSDEVHFGWGPQHTLRIIRKPGQRYCQDCLQHESQPATADQKRFCCWAAVGYQFKSPIQFYDIPSNKNGKMTQQAYIDQIFEPVVLP